MLKRLSSEVFQAYASSAAGVMSKRYSSVDIDRVKKFFNREKIYSQLNAMVSFLIPDRSNVKLILNVGGESFTDGQSITVGLPHIFIKSSYEEIFTVLQALTGHEAQHINSSDFEAYTNYQQEIADLFVSKYKGMNEPLLRHYMQKISVAFGNGVEDGRIEKILGAKFPGYIKYLKFMNGSMWNAHEIKGNSELEDFLYCIVSYSVTGLDPKGFNKVWKGTELEKNYKKIKPMIMKGINAISCRLCLSYCKDMIGMVEPYLVKLLEQRTQEDEEFLNNLPDKPEFTTSSEVDYNNDPSTSTHFKPEKKQQDKKEGQKEQQDRSKDEEEEKKQKGSSKEKNEKSEEKEEKDSTAKDSKSPKKDPADEEDSNDDQKDNGDSSKDENSEEVDDMGSSGKSDEETDEDDSESNDDAKGSGKSEEEKSDEESEDGSSSSPEDQKGDQESEDEAEGDDSDGEGDEESDSDSDKQSDSDGNGDSNDEQEPGDGDNYDDNLNNEDQIPDEELVKSAIEEIIDEIQEDAKDKVSEEPMNNAKKAENKSEADSKLNEQELSEIKNLYKNDIAKDFNEERGFPLRYPLPSEIKTEANRFRKEMERIFKNKEPYNFRGQKRGVLDSSNLWKIGVKETSVFVKRGVPVLNDYVAYLLWDGSGSMSSDKKLHYSGYAVSVAEEGLKGLIPFKITQFSVSARGVVHHVVKDFKEHSSMNYGQNFLYHRKAGGGNKDGYSIRVATAELMKRPEKDRILIIFSDGLPSDYSGGEQAGMLDVKMAVKEARSKGIFVVSLIFGKESFRDYNMDKYKMMYEKNIISCSPSEINAQLTKMLKKILAR